MKLFGIMLAKNEGDVIGDTLRSAASKFNSIFVYDTGSSDETWDIVQALAKEHPAIVPVERRERLFSNLIREEVLEAYRDRAEHGDWWCKLDADELYIEDPWVFLSKVPEAYELVYGASFQYYFTDRDLARYDADPTLYEAHVPIAERLRYYLNNWSEARFVRDNGGPIFRHGHPAGSIVYPQRIWLKHYKYRSPEQIAQRLSDRLKAAQVSQAFKHEIDPALRRGDVGAREPDWRDRVRNASDLYYDGMDGRLVMRDDLMPPVPLPPLVDELKLAAARIRAHLKARGRT